MLATVIHLPPGYTVQGPLLRDGNAHNGLGLPWSMNGQDSPLQAHPQRQPDQESSSFKLSSQGGGGRLLCCFPGSEAGFQLKTMTIQNLCPLHTCTHMHSHN